MYDDNISKEVKNILTNIMNLYQEDIAYVPIETIIKAFELSDKNYIMSDKELKQFNYLPEEWTIFRGSNGRDDVLRPSWTISESVAKKYGHIVTCKRISKKDVYAYFFENTDDDEMVVNPLKIE